MIQNLDVFVDRSIAILILQLCVCVRGAERKRERDLTHYNA